MYRAEALEGARAVNRGVPLRARQPSWRVVLQLFLPAVVAGIAFVTLASFDQRIRTEGALLPSRGLLVVPASASGQVVRIHPGQGDSVRAGDPLFELSNAALDGNASALRGQRRELLDAELASVRRASALERDAGLRQLTALRQRIDSLEADARSLQREHALGDERIALVEQKLPGMRRLTRDGLLSAMQMSDQEAALLALRADAESRQRQQRSLRRELDAARGELAALPGQQAAALSEQMHREHALRERLAELAAGASQVVRAQADGVLATLLVPEGASVVAGQPLAMIAPAADTLQAIVAVPVSAPGELRTGQRAVLRLPAFPHQRYGHFEGVVLEISGTPLSPQQLLEAGLPNAVAAMYRVVISLDRQQALAAGEALPLKPGMRVEADLLLSRRRLIDWLLDPLRDLRSRLPSGVKE